MLLSDYALPLSMQSKLKETNFDLRSFLSEELASRSRKNPGYSLRAFAKQLGLDSSRLSKILKGDRPISQDLALKVAEKLDFKTEEINKLCESYNRKEKQPSQRRSYRKIPFEEFKVISDWSHYAIMEALKLKDFRPNVRWLCKRLHLSASVINLCLKRLQRVGLLRITNGQKWVDTSEGFSTHIADSNLTSLAHRRHQKLILEQAIGALQKTPLENRSQTSMMMATSTERLEEAKQRIKKFRRELCEFLEAAENKDAIYQLSVSLFPLTKENKIYTKKTRQFERRKK